MEELFKSKFWLAVNLLDTGGQCVRLFTSCFFCPIKSTVPGHANCGRNQTQRIAWAKEYREQRFTQ